MKRFFRVLSNLFWPPKCVFCGNFLPLCTDADACYCSNCIELSRTSETMACLHCNTLLVSLSGKQYCPKCDATTVHFDGLCAPFYYENDIRRSVLLYKRYYRYSYLKTYAVFMAEQFYNSPSFYDCTCICAVPAWKWETFFSGENRAWYLEKAVHDVIPLPVLKGVLIKKRHTAKQKRLTAKERIKNVKNAYAVVAPEQVKDQIVLLLDDVYTTGATVNECARVLKQAGAKEVYVMTIAMRQ